MNFSFVRFLIVGLFNTGVGLTIMYLLLILFKQDYWISTFTGNTIGAAVSYILNRRFTFQSDASVLHSLIRFIVVIFICYFFSYQMGLLFILVLLQNLTSIPNSFNHELAILAGTMVYTITNYVGQKYVVFPEKKTDASLSEG